MAVMWEIFSDFAKIKTVNARIKEFYEDNIGKTFTGILSNALDKNFGR